MNRLYFGDNLTVLRDHVRDESVDLIYLDPPFNSRANYNVLFKGVAGQRSQAQAEAFQDTWEWGPSAEQAYDDIRAYGGDVAAVLAGMRRWLGDNGLMAYLAMMGVRLIELHRVLKPTGSLYLHCDPTASHYLKVLLDAVFDVHNFRSDVVWKRQTAHSDAKLKFATVSDNILFYAKSKDAPFHVVRQPLGEEYVKKFYKYEDADKRRYQLDNMAAPAGGGMAAINKRTGRPNGWYVWKGYDPPARGWRYSPETMAKLDADGLLYYPEDKSQRIRLKRYLDKNEGQVVSNIWTDIPPLHGSSGEVLGYPTQKPRALLERIISASSSIGDVVLDPFCGCGTTIDAAQHLGRRWIGMDVTHYAVTLIERRLRARHPTAAYTVHGRPTDLAGAVDLARRDKHQFQWWAAWRLGAQRYREEKRGADRGIDGRAHFKNGPYGDGLLIISVKGGDNVNVSMVRDLRGVIEREDAEMGILVTLVEPTGPMIAEAAAAGFVRQSAHGRLPRLQIVTVADLLDGRMPKLPPLPEEQVGRAPAPRRRKIDPQQMELLLPFVGGKQVFEKGEFVDPRFLEVGS
jgi:DNA modification methylase